MEPNDFVRENFIQPAAEFYTFCNEVYTDVKNACNWLDRNVDAFVKKHLPGNTHHVAMSIFRTLPETVVCGACMSGVSAAPAVLYLTVRVVAISLPRVQELLANLVDAKVLGDAIGKTAKELFATYKNFRPAIAMCAAIATVVSFIFGWGTGNVSLVMRSPLYAIVAYLAVADILRDAQAAVLVAEGGQPPRDPPYGESTQEGVPHAHASASRARSDSETGEGYVVVPSASNAASDSPTSTTDALTNG